MENVSMTNLRKGVLFWALEAKAPEEPPTLARYEVVSIRGRDIRAQRVAPDGLASGHTFTIQLQEVLSTRVEADVKLKQALTRYVQHFGPRIDAARAALAKL